ncbi:hypothetical protein DLE01_36540, partial [Streptomyces sp. FT05W]
MHHDPAVREGERPGQVVPAHGEQLGGEAGLTRWTSLAAAARARGTRTRSAAPARSAEPGRTRPPGRAVAY